MRLKEIWESLYNTAPENILPVVPFPKVIELMAESRRGAGNMAEGQRISSLAQRTDLLERSFLTQPDAEATRREIGALLSDVRERKLATPELRRTAPFALEGEFDAGVPFLLIEDAHLYDSKGAKLVNRKAWRSAGESPLVVHLGQVGSGARELLPQAYLFESANRVLRIQWNSARDLSSSKLMHTSIQPFYLRRYARRVAELWVKEYGRRPAVRAHTAMALNGRPHQELVDPEVDLASASSRWLRHNEWIRDLQTRRIPRSALTPGKRL